MNDQVGGPSGAPVVDRQSVIAAAERIRGHAHRTPVFTSRQLDERVGAPVYLKAENLQRVGAFKFRGAVNAISRLSDAQRRAGVVAYSSGNHAQAIALAAREFGVPATIVMPQDAPATKLAATRGYGASVVLYDRYTEDRAEIGADLARRDGLTLIPPYDHPDIIAGQGTATLELLADHPVEVVVAPLGGGGLLAGSILAAQASGRAVEVYGVEPEAGDDGVRSLRAGQIVRIETPATIADGAQTQFLGGYTFPVIRDGVADLVTVSDSELVEAMRFAAQTLKLVVEPTGVLGLAAVLNGRIPLDGRPTGIILSGGNVDLDRYAALLATP